MAIQYNLCKCHIIYIYLRIYRSLQLCNIIQITLKTIHYITKYKHQLINGLLLITFHTNEISRMTEIPVIDDNTFTFASSRYII